MGIFITHGHFDHVMGIDKWVQEYDIPVYLHEEEQKILETFIQDAKNEIAVLTAEKAQELTEARQRAEDAET